MKITDHDIHDSLRPKRQKHWKNALARAISSWLQQRIEIALKGGGKNPKTTLFFTDHERSQLNLQDTQTTEAQESLKKFGDKLHKTYGIYFQGLIGHKGTYMGHTE